MFEKILEKKTAISVTGLGYVGLPIALAFGRKVKVIGFDINHNRVEMMRNQIDPSGEMKKADFEDCDLYFTALSEELVQASFHIIAVPTPIDSYSMPDLKPLLAAAESVGKILKKGDCVVFESTVYPGCTEEECVPILEKQSNLKYLRDFWVGYSPERINPGDKEHTLTKITKVVAGCNQQTLDLIAKVYEIIVEAGVYKATSIKVAEAAKVIENTQRDLNIALMNELSMIFDKMNINTFEVLEAAGTKWNFLRFTPGLVGGHCIGVDPYYLTYKSKSLGHDPKVILSGRQINDEMAAYVAKKTVQLLAQTGKEIVKMKVLIMGATFKENVSDIRNSKVADLVKELKYFNVQVDIVDPHANNEAFFHQYGHSLSEKPGNQYNAIILAVAHEEYSHLDEDYFQSITTKNAIFIDIKGLYRNRIKQLQYWSL
ncbi:MAG: nucleotide sugar dehydrogenase [Verrucomicrobia bacterium]|nr:nucleotide sugar dehydrogenase [Cytophagales bacterium]